MATETLLEVRELSKRFPLKTGTVFRRTVGEIHAVTNVSFNISYGETVSIVGESGSGKTTLALMVAGLLRPSSGKIMFEGKDIWRMNKYERKEFQRKIGVIFQDPYSSLNPRMTVEEIVSEPMQIHNWGTRDERRERVKELLVKVGLSKNDIYRYPRQFSGGQLQRIALARALALEPTLVIADEPVAALDVSVQAKIVNLMKDLQRELGVAFLLISHDLGIVRYISKRVMILYLGHVMEMADSQQLFSKPLHPYTQALISSVLTPDPDKMKYRPPSMLKGEIPSPIAPPKGCKFSSRCPFVQDRCREKEPVLESAYDSSHLVSCFYWNEIQYIRNTE